MPNEAQLVVAKGAEQGREIAVPAGNGVRIGRSSSNDVSIPDTAASRFHCRIYLKPDEGLWVADLGSSNQTMVNDEPVQEKRVVPNDLVTVGDTVFRIVSDDISSAEPVPVVAGTPIAEPAQHVEPDVDLGFQTTAEPGSSSARVSGRSRRLLLIAVLVLAAVGAAGIWAVKFFEKKTGTEGVGGTKGVPDVNPAELEIRYEKVDASSRNVFWYELTIKNGKAALEMHDLKNRHVTRAFVAIKEKVLRELTRDVLSSGFFELPEADYIGRSAKRNSYLLMDLAAAMGPKVKRVRVQNNIEPRVFEKVRTRVEEFGRVQFGTMAMANSVEELTEMASDALELGKKLYQEKDVQHGNLHKAIRAYADAANLVEDIDPKPDFYKEVVRLRVNTEEELDLRHEQLMWDVERSIKLQDWEDAAKWLRVVCASIPDRQDRRFKNAEMKLIEVEQHLGQ